MTMSKTAFVLLCLVCTGNAQTLQSKALSELLQAGNPSAAFHMSVPQARSSPTQQRATDLKMEWKRPTKDNTMYETDESGDHPGWYYAMTDFDADADKVFRKKPMQWLDQSLTEMGSSYGRGLWYSMKDESREVQDQCLGDMDTFIDLFENDPDVKNFVTDQSLYPESKMEFIDSVGDAMQPPACWQLRLVLKDMIEFNRYEWWGDLRTAYALYLKAGNKEHVVDVVTSSEDLLPEIEKKVKEYITPGWTYELAYKLDPKLQGGYTFVIDESFEFSTAGKETQRTMDEALVALLPAMAKLKAKAYLEEKGWLAADFAAVDM